MAVTVGTVGVRPREGSFGRTFRKSSPAYLMLSPYLILFVVVLAYPLLYSIYLSFFDATLNRTPTFVGAGNFIQLFNDAEFHTALRNTFFFAFFVVLGESILPLLMALAMNEHLPFRTLFRTAFFLPVVCSWVVVSLLWSMLFAPQGLYEAASVDGATRWRQLWHIAVPALRPVIYFVLTISLITSMQLFIQPFIMTNGGPLNSTISMVQLLYRHAFVELQFGYGSAIATFLLVLLVALALINKRVHDLVVR